MFVWMMLALKIPIAALLYLVWWASRPPEAVEPEQRELEPLRPPDHPRRPRRPRPPRRGPHAEPVPAPPKRTRVHARRLTTRH